MGLLLALLHDGAAGPLLIERRYTLTEQVRQLIMLSPAKLWTARDSPPSCYGNIDAASAFAARIAELSTNC